MRTRERDLMERLEARGVMDRRRRALTAYFIGHPSARYDEAVTALGYPEYMLSIADSIKVDLATAARERRERAKPAEPPHTTLAGLSMALTSAVLDLVARSLAENGAR